jgi:hypothetical protein
MPAPLPERRPPSRSAGGAGVERSLTLRLDGFAWDALEEEAARLGVPVEELASFALLYYLADLDSGRIARELPPGRRPTPGRRPRRAARG